VLVLICFPSAIIILRISINNLLLRLVHLVPAVAVGGGEVVGGGAAGEAGGAVVW
jgi:hypothetical protein